MHKMNSASNTAQEIAYPDIFNSTDAAAIQVQEFHFLPSAF